MTEQPTGAGRICLCIAMTQPLADQIPLLRRIYSPSFSRIVFLLPFERLDDPDVITVYRGPYARAGYLTDALPQLAAIECDHFLVIDHDVLLNPLIDEKSIARVVPLGPDDGFFPAIAPPPAAVGAWSRYFGLVPKLAFPKSLLFGSGIEREVLRAYLPDRDEAVHRMEAIGAPFRTAATLDTRSFGDVVAAPSRVLLHGETAALPDGTPAQRASDSYSLTMERALVAAMAASIAGEQDAEQVGKPDLKLTLPVTGSATPVGLYGLPRSRLEAFAHYAGIASAANLDADFVIPTLLCILCDRVWNAADYRISVSGMIRDADLSRLAHPRQLAIKPFQTARFQTPARQAALLDQLATLRNVRRRRAIASVGLHRLGLGGTLEGFAHDGWHARESWGRWSSQTTATMRFWVPADADIGAMRLGLVVPVHAKLPQIRAFVSLNEGERLEIQKEFPDAPETEMLFAAGELRAGAMNHLTIEMQPLARPFDLAPTTGDKRRLGIGVSFIEFTPRDDPNGFGPPLWPTPPVAAETELTAPRPGLIDVGWHPEEDWGRWARLTEASMRFRIAQDVTVLGLRVRVRAPIDPGAAHGFSGTVSLNGHAAVPIEKAPTDPESEEIVFPPDQIDFDGVNTLLLSSARTVRPINLNPAVADLRELGLGLISFALVTPSVDALRLPTPGLAAGHERFYNLLQQHRQGGNGTPVALPGVQPINSEEGRGFTATGWHGIEPWGRWSAFPHAALQFWVSSGETIERIDLALRSPPTPRDDPATGRVRLNGGEWAAFVATPEVGDRVDVSISGDTLAHGGMNWIEIESNRMVRVSEADPGSPDQRILGFGIFGVTFR